MADNQSGRPDPLEVIPPRTSTVAERRTIAVVGGLAIVVAVAVLVRALGTGTVPVSAADELSARPHRRPVGDRVGDRVNERADEHR